MGIINKTEFSQINENRAGEMLKVDGKQIALVMFKVKMKKNEKKI